jgi:hypothetical protein
MNTADKLMNIAIDGDPGEETVVETRSEPERDEDEAEIVEETTLTRKVRVAEPKPRPKDHVIIVED